MAFPDRIERTLTLARGRELASIGFGQDVAVAAELDASASVPTLAGARFVDASRSPMSHIGRTDAPT